MYSTAWANQREIKDTCIEFVINISHRKVIMRNQIELKSGRNFQRFTAWKVSKYGVSPDSYFPVFGLNTEIYGVNLRI